MDNLNDRDVNQGPGGRREATRSTTGYDAATTATSGRIVFPWMLHRLLDESEANGSVHIVSWLPCDRAFKIHRRENFTRDILPKYYRQTRYKSFVRQLNLWGFTCITQGPNKGSYSHDSFIRGETTRCNAMKRVKIKGHAAALAVATTFAQTPSDHHVPLPNTFADDVATPTSTEDVSLPSFADDAPAASTSPAQLDLTVGGYERKIRFVITPPVSEFPIADASPSGDLSAPLPAGNDWFHLPRTSDSTTPTVNPQQGAVAIQRQDATVTKTEEPAVIPFGNIADDDAALHSSIGNFHFSFDRFDDLDFELFQF